MASGWNSGSEREAMLRRVAIVLNSLPAPIASKLLGAIDDEKKQAVRRTMSTLADVDPLERQRAIKAFKVMVERHPVATTKPVPTNKSGYKEQDSRDRGIEPLQSDATSPASWKSTPNANSSPLESSKSSPMSFLGDIDDQTLANVLTAEHPQTIALVLASISPEQAARILSTLDARLQQATMSRIGRLGEIPETAMIEVGEHFRHRLQTQTQTQSQSSRQTLGQKALDAILNAMPRPASIPMSNQIESHSMNVGGEARSTVANHTSTFESFNKLQPGNIDNPESSVAELAKRLRVIGESSDQEPGPEDFLESESIHQKTHKTVQRERMSDAETVSMDTSDFGRSDADHAILDSTDSTHHHLIGLKPAELCRALGMVDTRDAMLALCGLPVQITNAALAVLPRAQAKVVRAKMNSLGNLHLRDIDIAKERVAQASLSVPPSASIKAPLAA